MVWRREDPQGNEAAKISWEIVRYTRGRGLDIGAGLYRTFPHFITVDNNIDQVLFGHPMPRPDIFVEDAKSLDLFASESMDFIFSSHMLEHVPEDDLVKTLKEWLRVVRLNGYLILYLPDADEYPKVGEPGANPDHKWNVTYNALVSLMVKAGHWDLVDYQKRNEDNEYSLLFVFQKKHKGQTFSCDTRVTPLKTAGVVRYGAFGDLMQASSVCAALKADGYHVTLYCANPGYEVIKHDPHIDEFYIQDRDQVPNPALDTFWRYHAKKYDKWVNLSESVEGTLLTIRNRIVDTYSPRVRHELCNRNYVEYAHFLAGVDHHEPNVRFYPTADEEAWASEERKKYGEFVVAWVLNGSSKHKVWPWMDPAILGLLADFPEVQVVLIGGADGVVLEQGFEKLARVHCRSGKWGIRQTLSFVRLADVVIGPETGTMNSVSMCEMPKVCFLSHSTQENLTRDWVNCHSLASVGTHCRGRGADEAPACHQMHYTWDTCTEAPAVPGTEALYKRKGSGVAQCQYDIGPEDAYRVIWHVVQWRLEEYAKRDGKPMPGIKQAGPADAIKDALEPALASPAEVIEPPRTKSVIEL